MVMRKRVRLIWLFAAGAAVCAAQQDQRAAAVQLADHYAAVYQVPRELVHSIIEVESGWHPRAVSSKGAVGLMQLMPATAATFGVTNRFEIEQNIRGGVAYLARLLKLFNGDLRLVAAAYLTGESANSAGRPEVLKRRGLQVCGQSGAIVQREAIETPPD